MATHSPVSRHHFSASDGTDLVWHEMGAGRPVVLIHGYFSSAFINWIRYGHAGKLAAPGFRVIMPDLRAHGDSGKPHDPAAYPPDILADDNLALIDHLGLKDYDLGGYSLGGRTVARMLARGAAPGRAIIAGMGLAGLIDTASRSGFFRKVLTKLGSFERGSSEWMTEAFLKTSGGDPKALLLILDTFVDTPEPALRAIEIPVLALGGKDDEDNGSIDSLSRILPKGQHVTVPGNHMSAVVAPEFGNAMVDFLTA